MKDTRWQRRGWGVGEHVIELSRQYMDGRRYFGHAFQQQLYPLTQPSA